jgi:hypothetical protein
MAQEQLTEVARHLSRHMRGLEAEVIPERNKAVSKGWVMHHGVLPNAFQPPAIDLRRRRERSDGKVKRDPADQIKRLDW